MKNSFIKVIKDENFRDLISDVNEVILDSFLKDGIIKDIPIIGVISKTINLGNSIQERLYTKKLLTFLKQLEEIDDEDRIAEINKIDNNEKYKTKVGEKLLYIIDNADDCEKAEYIGILFKFFLRQKLCYDDFIRCVNCINKINLVDLNVLIDNSFSESFINRNIENYLNTELITLEYKNPMNENRKNRLITYEKAQIKYVLSTTGNHLRSFFYKR